MGGIETEGAASAGDDRDVWSRRLGGYRRDQARVGVILSVESVLGKKLVE